MQKTIRIITLAGLLIFAFLAISSWAQANPFNTPAAYALQCNAMHGKLGKLYGDEYCLTNRKYIMFSNDAQRLAVSILKAGIAPQEAMDILKKHSDDLRFRLKMTHAKKVDA